MSEGSIQQSMTNNQKRMETSILSHCTMPGNIQSIWQACFLQSLSNEDKNEIT